MSSSVFLLYSQTIPILLATLSSIHSPSQNLSLWDAHTAVATSLSPMTVYVAACCILHRCGVETSLFRKISSPGEVIILWLGLAIVPLWLSVSLVTSFSSTAFRNSNLCANMTIPRYLGFMVLSSMSGALDILG